MNCIGINTLFIVPGKNRGVQTYLDHLILELGKLGNHRYKLFVSESNREHYQQFEGVELVSCPVDGRSRSKRVAYEQFRLQDFAMAEGCDLLFFPGYLSPVCKRMPFVVTIPDTQFLDIPEMVPMRMKWLYRLIVPRSVKHSDHVITISNFSRDRILTHLPVSGDRVTVAPLAAGFAVADERSRSKDEVFKEVGLKARGFDSRKPYLISVSSANRHKNLEKLLAAFSQSNQGRKFQLVLVGVEQGLPGDDIFFTGFLSDRDRDALYRNAHGYVFPSKYEGFGLPLLEAMAAEIPIACSTAGALPEVGGEACLYFDPEDISGMAEAIRTLCEDEGLRSALIRKGGARQKVFSWEKCAATTEMVFERVLAENSVSGRDDGRGS